MTVLAISRAIALVAVGAVHALWGARIWWPVGDEARLTRAVLGARGAVRMPSALACYLVALALAASAFWVGLLAGWMTLPLLPRWAVPAGGALIAAVFLLRGVAGYLPGFVRVTPEEPFRRLDRRVYSPFCLALGAGVAVMVQMSWA